jgi:ubiquinone/menaquinone biosynthesis C-methylase UbiE
LGVGIVWRYRAGCYEVGCSQRVGVDIAQGQCEGELRMGSPSASDRWQVSASAAENYERSNVPWLFGPWAEVLVERAGVTTGQRVLDLACGTGVVARLAAEKVGPSGGVIGLDLNEGMLAEAARHVPSGLTIQWELADAQDLPFDGGDFDVVLCQQGLQFVPNQERAAAEMLRVLRSGGLAAVAVWASLEQNPVAHARNEGLIQYLQEDLSRPFAQPDADEWARLFEGVGFSSVKTVTVELVNLSDDPRAAVEGNLETLPIADKIKAMDDATYQAMIDDMVASLTPWMTDGTLLDPTTSNLILARR